MPSEQTFPGSKSGLRAGPETPPALAVMAGIVTLRRAYRHLLLNQYSLVLIHRLPAASGVQTREYDFSMCRHDPIGTILRW